MSPKKRSQAHRMCQSDAPVQSLVWKLSSLSAVSNFRAYMTTPEPKSRAKRNMNLPSMAVAVMV